MLQTDSALGAAGEGLRSGAGSRQGLGAAPGEGQHPQHLSSGVVAQLFLLVLQPRSSALLI